MRVTCGCGEGALDHHAHGHDHHAETRRAIAIEQDLFAHTARHAAGIRR